MLADYRCFFCFVRSMEKMLEKENFDPDKKRRFTFEMTRLYQQTENGSITTSFSRELYACLREYSGNSDPYKEIKKSSNEFVLGLYPEMKKLVQESVNPFETALRLAISGNIIDYAINDQFDLMATIDKVLNSDFAINHSAALRAAIEKAETVLYLGDNCGEIVFDKLFIETIAHPNLIYAVRGAPVINDATMEDAEFVGMTNVARVVSNGYDAPSTLVEHCSEEFLEIYNKADVIISKGQGNLEGLFESPNQHIFFLLMVKCNVVAERLGVKKDSFVVRQNKGN
jgi:damage-control phosphatase, subfamily I